MPIKKKQAEGPRKGAYLMDQFGLGINTKEFEPMFQDDDGDDDDADILAELAALEGDISPPKVNKNKGIVTLSDIARMAAKSMQDIQSDEEMSENEDPELLRELNELMNEKDTPTPAPSIPVSVSDQVPVSRPDVFQQPSNPSTDSVTLLKDRLSMYSSALSNTDEPNKKRRLTRGIKTLEELLKDAKTGHTIQEDTIPPPVSVRRKEPPSVKPQGQPTLVQVQPPLPERNNVPRQEDSPIRSAAPVLPPRNIVERPPGQPPIGAVSVLPPLPPKPSLNAARSPVKSPSPSSSSMPSTRSPQPPQQLKPVKVVDQMKHPIPESSGANSTHCMLSERRDQYKSAAVVAKKSGDIATATKYAHVAKQFENVIKALEENKSIDLSKMPPPPPGYKVLNQFQTTSNNNNTINSHSGQVHQDRSVKEVSPSSTSDEIPNLSPSALKKLYKIPDAPSSVEEALQQRLNKYKTVEEEAKKSGNGSKARRMGRIAKEYENAIKMYKAGKPVNFDELPTPPGFPPIPLKDSKPPSSSTSGSSVTSPNARQVPMKPPAQTPVAKQQQATQQDLSEQEIRKRAFARRSISSRQEQHIAFLKERMAEYRQAAIQARKNQNMELAKAYLRQVKGFEPMIEAAEGGLPVDLSKVPPPLISDEDQAEKFRFVNPEDCTLSGDREEVFKKLQESLVAQIQMCATNNKHFTKLGDVLSASRFQTLEQSCIKDLDSLKNALHHGDPVPRFHYETTSFSMVKCNTDLGDNDFELIIVRGINYNPPSSYTPKDLDTYIKFEFPFPADDPQVHTTETVKGKDCPEYNESIRLQINRKSRAMLRIFEKKSLKFEIYYRRGFLKSDKVLGTVNIKLQSLENKCTVHDSYDLMDGRKSVGGKLEVRLRLRDPLKNKQVEEMKEKILIIDQFLRKKTDENTSSNATTNVNQKKGTVSMEVLRFEKQQLDKQISHLRDNLNQSQLQALTNKSKLLQEKLLREQENLKTKGADYWKAYIAHITNDMKSYAVEAQVLAKRGDIQKAHVMMTKKKLVEKEIAALQSRIADA